MTWFLIFSPVILFVLLIVGILMFGDLPSIEELQNPKSSLATVVYSGDGEVLGKYYKENRVNVKFAQLDSDLVNALVSTEDERFYDHSGVDLKALGRSVKGLVTGNSSAGGGSTLTQQLAKMQFPREKLGKFKMIFRKIKEWIIAARLEKQYTKDEILTMYLNKFDFLNQAVGINSAAHIYFGASQDSLKIEQAAMLIGMAKNPSMFNPLRKQDTTLHRRNVVLAQMKKNGKINQTQFDSLKKLPLGIKFHPEDHNLGLAPYLREYIRDNFMSKWCSEHINPETNKPYDIYKDGLRIYTTVDSRMQKYAEEAASEHMKDLQGLFDKDCKQKKNAPFAWNVNKDDIERIITSAMKRSDRYRTLKKGGYNLDMIVRNFKTPTNMRIFSWKGDIDTLMTPWDSIRYYKSILQCGFMAIEPQTGYVKAWVGGINHTHFKYDHVKVGARQVGSTFKPFVYALAIQEGMSPCHQVLNVRTCITTDDGKEWCPDNSSKEHEGELLTLKRALAGSVNYVSAWVMKQYNPQAVINLVRSMGITSKIDPTPSICLGTPDITVFEMVGANATFANKGVFTTPTYILRIEDKNGKVLEEFVPKTNEVFNEEKAYVMLQLMRGVVDHGTGGSLRSRYKLTNPIAGKTGTTQNNSDGWFMGITPDLVAGCWVGAEDRSVHFNSTDQGQGARMALPIWGKFFQKVYADKSLKVSKGDFERPLKMGDVELDCEKYDSQIHDEEEPEWEE
ncbi:MAG: transglycosylase domain-containing protein [Bacteroidia bacterium]|nr:transglycosylase domain-containing protein [Bacteroidia bacterium]